MLTGRDSKNTATSASTGSSRERDGAAVLASISRLKGMPVGSHCRPWWLSTDKASLAVVRFANVTHHAQSKEGNSLLKTTKCQVFLMRPPPSPSLDGASPIRHPRGPPQSPKPTKNTTEITRFGLAVFLVGKEGNSPLKTTKCQVFLIRPTPSPSLGGASPIRHPRGPPQSPKATKNTTKITRFGSHLTSSVTGTSRCPTHLFKTILSIIYSA